MKSPHFINRSMRLAETLALASAVLFVTVAVCSAQTPIRTKTPDTSPTVRSAADKCLSGNCVNGKGKRAYGNGDIYEGDFVQGKRAGRGTFTSKDGEVYTGQFANDKYNGKGKLEGDFIEIYEGDFVDGKKEGHGTATGVLNDVYTGSFSNDKYNGKGKLAYANGAVYVGDFVDDRFEGQATLTYKNGDYYTGAWKNYKRNGYGKEFIKATNTVREGIWKDDVWAGATNSQPAPPTSSRSNIASSNSPLGETAALLRDTLNGKFNFIEGKPLVYKLTEKKSGETLLFKIDFINDGGKLAFKWMDITKNEQSEKLAITEKAINSASKYVNFFSTKSSLAPDKEITFILSQTLYQELKSNNEIQLDLGKGLQRISFNYSLTAITGIYSRKNLKLLALQGDDSGTAVRVLDDPLCPLIVEIETSEYKLELTNTSATATAPKTEPDWQKVGEPFVSRMEAAVNAKKDDLAMQIYTEFGTATSAAGASTSLRNTRKVLLKTMHRSNSYPLMKFVREKLKTLNYNEEETKDILSPRQFYV